MVKGFKEKYPFLIANEISDRHTSSRGFFVKEGDGNYPTCLFVPYLREFIDVPDIALTLYEVPPMNIVDFEFSKASDKNHILCKPSKIGFWDSPSRWRMTFKIPPDGSWSISISVSRGCLILHGYDEYKIISMLSIDSNFKEYMKMLYLYPEMVQSDFYETGMITHNYLSEDGFINALLSFRSIDDGWVESCMDQIRSTYSSFIAKFISYYNDYLISSRKRYNLVEFLDKPNPVFQTLGDIDAFNLRFSRNLVYSYIVSGSDLDQAPRYSSHQLDSNHLRTHTEVDELYLLKHEINEFEVSRRTIQFVAYPRVE